MTAPELNDDFRDLLSCFREAKGRDELIRNKRAAARPKDLVDVAALERRR